MKITLELIVVILIIYIILSKFVIGDFNIYNWEQVRILGLILISFILIIIKYIRQ